jgi:hypothetical protein
VLLVVGATPLQMGVPAAGAGLPVLAIRLVAGVWMDRLRRRRIMLCSCYRPREKQKTLLTMGRVCPPSAAYVLTFIRARARGPSWTLTLACCSRHSNVLGDLPRLQAVPFAIVRIWSSSAPTRRDDSSASAITPSRLTPPTRSRLTWSCPFRSKRQPSR